MTNTDDLLVAKAEVEFHRRTPPRRDLFLQQRMRAGRDVGCLAMKTLVCADRDHWRQADRIGNHGADALWFEFVRQSQ